MNDDAVKLISERLDRIERLTLIAAKPVLDLTEAAMFTGYSKDHIYRLTCGREIPHYKQSRKLYFRKTELEEWMTSQRVKTNAEIDCQAATYCATH